MTTRTVANILIPGISCSAENMMTASKDAQVVVCRAGTAIRRMRIAVTGITFTVTGTRSQMDHRPSTQPEFADIRPARHPARTATKTKTAVSPATIQCSAKSAWMERGGASSVGWRVRSVSPMGDAARVPVFDVTLKTTSAAVRNRPALEKEDFVSPIWIAAQMQVWFVT